MEKPSHNTKQTLIVLTLLLLHIGRDECKDTEPLSACVDMPNFSNVVLNKTDIFPVDIKLTLRAGVLTTYPTHASIQAVKMIEERYYCYDGTNIDPNTGCQHTVKVWELSAEELNQWKSKNGLCKVGVTCQFEGSCWGSTASACLLPQADQRTRWAKPDDLMGPLLPFLVFPHHTCTKGYRCSNHELKLPIQAGIVSEQGTHFPLVTLVDGKSKKLQVDVEDHFFEEGVNYLHGKITPKQDHVQASCFKTKFEVETCVILKDGVSRTVTLDKNCIGVTGNLVLALNCDFSGNKSSESAYYTNKGMIDTASSIGDLVKVSEQLLFYSAQNEFNIANLGAEVEKIKNSLIDLIRVLMVRDPHLIGVMTNSPIRSRANADGSSFSFQQCPHPNLPSGKLKACTQMFEMRDGVYVYRPISKPCPVEASNKTTTYLKLLDRSTLSFIELDRPEFNGANIDNPTIKTFKEDFAQAIKKSYSETIQQGESLPYNPYEELSRFYEGLKTAFSFIGGTYAILMLIKLLCAIRYSNKEI